MKIDKVINFSLKFFFFTFVSLLNVSVSAAAVDETKKAKCHVELIGGGTTIYYAMVNQNQFDQLSAQLPGREIRAPGYSKNKSVYRTIECTWDNKRFQSALARNVERKQAK